MIYLPSTMRAAVLKSPRTLSIEHVPVPHFAPDEVLVRVDAVGLCGSDVHCYTGERSLSYPMVLGHEIAGRIIAIGTSVLSERLGERVAVEPNIPCGLCALCARGLGRICPHKQTIGMTRWGGLAEYVVVPASFAWSIPETFALSDAATIEPMAVAVHAFNRAQIEFGETLAVIGCGGVGFLLVTMAVAHGHHVVVLEPNPVRRAAAIAAGATEALKIHTVSEARALFKQNGIVTLFECAGVPATTQLCLDAASPGSHIILVGLATENVALNPLRFVHRELEIRGALIYEHPRDFEATIDLIACKKLAPGITAGQPQPLEKVSMLLEAMATGTLDAKPLVSPYI